MTWHVNDSGTWKQVNSGYVNDSGTGKEVQEGHVNDGGTWKPFYTATNIYLFTGGADDEVTKLDPSNMTSLGSYTGHTATIGSLAFGSGYLFSGSQDYEVHKINPSDMTQASTFTGHSQNVYALKFGSDGYLYSGGGDADHYKIDPSTMSSVNSVYIYDGAFDIDYGSDGYLYYASTDGESAGEIHKVNPSDMSIDSTYSSQYFGTVNALAYGSDGYLYSHEPPQYAGNPASLAKIDPSTMSRVDSYSDSTMTDTIDSIIYASDGYVYFGFGTTGGPSTPSNGWVYKIDPSTMSKSDSYTGHSNVVNAISEGDSYIYSGSNDTEVHKINPSTMSQVDSHTGLAGARESVLYVSI